MKIHYGFVRTKDKQWYSLNHIVSFMVTEDGQIWAIMPNRNLLVEEWKNEGEAQKALDSAFHLYHGYKQNFIEMCEEHDNYLSIRLQNILTYNGIKSVEQVYELFEKGDRLPNMGKKTWFELSEAVKKMRYILP